MSRYPIDHWPPPLAKKRGIEKRLVRAGERRYLAEQRRYDATATLRACVEDAATAGWPKTRIAEVAGVSRQTVHEILR